MGECIYLTDDQYVSILKKARRNLDNIRHASGRDSTNPGDKYTETNVGLCNEDGLTTEDTALWPEQFPDRKTMKYRRSHHKCPLDTRPVSYEMQSGCFYTCRFFKQGLRDLAEIKRLYDERIAEAVLNAKGDETPEEA